MGRPYQRETRVVSLREDFPGNRIAHDFSISWRKMLLRNTYFRRSNRVTRSHDMVTVLDAMTEAGFVDQIVVHGATQIPAQKILNQELVEFSDEWTAFHVEGLGAIVFRFKSAADAVSFKLHLIP